MKCTGIFGCERELKEKRERESVSMSSCQRETWTERNISGTASAGKIKKKMKKEERTKEKRMTVGQC